MYLDLQPHRHITAACTGTIERHGVFTTFFFFEAMSWLVPTGTCSFASGAGTRSPIKIKRCLLSLRRQDEQQQKSLMSERITSMHSVKDRMQYQTIHHGLHEGECTGLDTDIIGYMRVGKCRELDYNKYQEQYTISLQSKIKHKGGMVRIDRNEWKWNAWRHPLAGKILVIRLMMSPTLMPVKSNPVMQTMAYQTC